ncbi:YciI family protein [Mesobacterium pallidum]|uniref:YciI family protein n=1 Tax=Mesobacterium pallidum TaxID=2872037 RepID=UPI001EE38B95|nr:YciI family protein [Mesobacterium pallidum]
MPKYLYVYHGGGMPEGEAAQAESMARWGAWMAKTGAALVDPGNPVGMSKTVGKDGVTDGGGADPCMGYTIVEAESLDAACDMARDNPMIADGGRVEVAEIHVIEM